MTDWITLGEREEWLSKDLVVDTRETWKNWFVRQLNFEDPPLIPREDLPEDFQPHRSFYGKLSCMVNGIDPNPPAPDNNLRHSAPNVLNNQLIGKSSSLGQVVPLRFAASEYQGGGAKKSPSPSAAVNIEVLNEEAERVEEAKVEDVTLEDQKATIVNEENPDVSVLVSQPESAFLGQS